MGKKNFAKPTMDIITFEMTDALLSSGNKGYQSDPFDKNPFEGGQV